MKNLIILFALLITGCSSININWVSREKGTVYKIDGAVVCVKYDLINSMEEVSNCFLQEGSHNYVVGDSYPN